MRTFLPWLVSLGLLTSAAAAPQEFVSGETRTHLVELFTSEGCSSCPPAEAWLSGLRTAPGLWHDFVPVAWHVNYWDRLGWKDRFASKSATERQYAYADRWRGASVYTPCFVLDGREWRERAVPKASPATAGMLRVRYDGRKLDVDFDSAKAGDYDAHAVILGLGIVSQVKAGENRGRELHHDFVAVTPPRSAPLRDGRTEIELRRPEDTGAADHAVAVWVTRRGELAPVQAVGGAIAR